MFDDKMEKKHKQVSKVLRLTEVLTVRCDRLQG